MPWWIWNLCGKEFLSSLTVRLLMPVSIHSKCSVCTTGAFCWRMIIRRAKIDTLMNYPGQNSFSLKLSLQTENTSFIQLLWELVCWGKFSVHQEYGKSFVYLWRKKRINSNTFHSPLYEYSAVYNINNLQWWVTPASVYTCVIHSNSAAWQSPAVKEQHEKAETIHQGKSVLNSKVLLQFPTCSICLRITSYRKLCVSNSSQAFVVPEQKSLQ